MLRIGVTGHRWNRILPAQSRALEASLRRAFAELPVGEVTLVTGMAEGTDLAACAARPEAWVLEAVLPLPEARWRATLARAPKVLTSELGTFDREIPFAQIVVPEPEAPMPAYVAVARYIAETSDRIIAVWSGGSGPPGGTSDVVQLARDRGIPVKILWPIDLSDDSVAQCSREN